MSRYSWTILLNTTSSDKFSNAVYYPYAHPLALQQSAVRRRQDATSHFIPDSCRFHEVVLLPTVLQQH